jgi:hypothetical protein
MKYSQRIAVGDEPFFRRMKNVPGTKGIGRRIHEVSATGYQLKGAEWCELERYQKCKLYHHDKSGKGLSG